MNIKRIVHYILLVLVVAFIGQIFYYSIWMITDDEFRAEVFTKGGALTSWQTLIDYLMNCIFTTFATIFYWRSRERTEKERELLRLQVLDNQLSPHFVFNNFSILADLIEINPPKASEYLMNLSKVYRYSLMHQEHQTVSLVEELVFLQQYLQLLKERFGSGIQVDIEKKILQTDGFIPPCTLQMVIENAIKHNEHTTSRPLFIRVSGNSQSITVINNRQPVQSVDSANVGQHNIEERYRLLTRQKVLIEKRENEYSVTLPLIEAKL